MEVAKEFNAADAAGNSDSDPPGDPTMEALDEIRSLCDQVEMDLAKKKRKPNTPPEEAPAAVPTEEEM